MTATGQGIVARALGHQGEAYVLGATARLDRPWNGPWDCSLFASKMVYEESGIVYGCTGADPMDPAEADPYTGAWAHDARTRGTIIPVDEAMSIPGACLLRVGARIGHIVICQGRQNSDGWLTIEAAGAAYGVLQLNVENRRWDMGVLVPGIDYDRAFPGPVTPAPKVFRMTSPPMRGDEVAEIQRALLRAGFNPYDLDGVYGPQTVNAVIQFQRAKGLVADGEVGPVTLHALGVM
jgi:N-acetylmuramoyl-L-alanine amidase